MKTKEFKRTRKKLLIYPMLISILSISVFSCEVEPGLPGPAGQNGEDGAKGDIGPIGAKGDDGLDGQNFDNFLQDFSENTNPFFSDGNDAWSWVYASHIGNENISFAENSMLASGNITDNQTSDLHMSLDLPHSSLFTFEVSISSEVDGDFLNWYVDDELINGISGIGGPFVFYFNVAEGQHDIRFSYEKNEFTTLGLDYGLLDNVEINNYSESTKRINVLDQLPSSISMKLKNK
ncbi:MAG: collagen-like protein [Reichenbachiella sp.]